MVMLNCSYNDLKKAIGHDLSEEELRTVLFDMGYELDAVVGDELAIEITAERLDVLSVQGMARAMKAFLSGKPLSPYQVHDSNQIVTITPAVSKVRPHTVCALVKNLHLTDALIKQIIDVQEKLHATLGRGRRRGAIGIYPLEAITLPITFTAAKPQDIRFHPLESDREMSAIEIIEEHPTGKTYGPLLQGYDMFPYFVDAKGDVLSVPPIINSEKTGRVNISTTEIFIECSGHEQSVLDELLVYLTMMFADMGGEVYSMKVAYPDGSTRVTPDLSPQNKTLHVSNIKKYLGLELEEKIIEELLAKMMYTIVSKDKVKGEDVLDRAELETVYHLQAPRFRYDLWHEIDIVDDIARVYGYNKLPLTLPVVNTIGSRLELSRMVDELSEVMAGLGFLETYTFSLTGKEEQLVQMNIDEDKIDIVNVSNGNEVQTMLRVSLLPQQLTSLAINKKHPLPQKIFEGAFVVLPDETKDVKARNEMHFSALITDKTVSFTAIKQTLDALLASRGLEKEITIQKTEHPSFLKGRSGKILYQDKPIGIIGEVHPQVLERFGIASPVACFEINIEPLL
ncbi:MAG: phenylalanine--tRNA ligase subunit beta [Nanoarchaeota archaeon]|nr:phenylalanine--tRNA ligase subunit beta [Nanoarchaeota archaeon]